MRSLLALPVVMVYLAAAQNCVMTCSCMSTDGPNNLPSQEGHSKNIIQVPFVTRTPVPQSVVKWSPKMLSKRRRLKLAKLLRRRKVQGRVPQGIKLDYQKAYAIKKRRAKEARLRRNVKENNLNAKGGKSKKGKRCGSRKCSKVRRRKQRSLRQRRKELRKIPQREKKPSFNKEKKPSYTKKQKPSFNKEQELFSTNNPTYDPTNNSILSRPLPPSNN